MLLELKEALELFMSQGPKLVNTIRLQLADCLFRLPSLVAADVLTNVLMLRDFTESVVGLFKFFNWKIWHHRVRSYM